MNMKRKYLALICLLSVFVIVFLILLFSSRIGENPRIEKAIQSVAVFVAMITAIIAIAVSDTPKRHVKVQINISFERRDEYSKEQMTEDLKECFSDFDDPVESYRVQFNMVNTSGFNLKRPTLTFRLPRERQHPKKPPKNYKGQADPNVCTIRSFHSNLYNSQDELRILEFADTLMISNSNMPYWNDQDSIMFWIRMALNDTSRQSFLVYVSVNCENADGITKEVQVSPKKI